MWSPWLWTATKIMIDLNQSQLVSGQGFLYLLKLLDILLRKLLSLTFSHKNKCSCNNIHYLSLKTIPPNMEKCIASHQVVTLLFGANTGQQRSTKVNLTRPMSWFECSYLIGCLLRSSQVLASHRQGLIQYF